MFKLKPSLILILLSTVMLTATAATPPGKDAASDNNAMNMPKPVENKVYDGMVGTWEGTSEMMGKKMHEVMKAHWSLNHQFLMVEVKATPADHPKAKYEGLGLFGVDKDGKAKTFWFDSWGAESSATGSGTFSDNKFEMTDSNAMFKETRSFELKGKELVMRAKGTFMKDGKEEPFDVTTVYKKK